MYEIHRSTTSSMDYILIDAPNLIQLYRILYDEDELYRLMVYINENQSYTYYTLATKSIDEPEFEELYLTETFWSGYDTIPLLNKNHSSTSKYVPTATYVPEKISRNPKYREVDIEQEFIANKLPFNIFKQIIVYFSEETCGEYGDSNLEITLSDIQDGKKQFRINFRSEDPEEPLIFK